MTYSERDNQVIHDRLIRLDPGEDFICPFCQGKERRGGNYDYYHGLTCPDFREWIDGLLRIGEQA